MIEIMGLLANLFMKYNGKEVKDSDTFEYSSAMPGDYVAEEVVDEAINCLPPACMRSECTQLGEPYSHKQDPDTGRYRATYATFKHVAGNVWEYCGHCFCGENTERWCNPTGTKAEQLV